MKVQQDSSVGGKWLDKKAVKTGDIAKIKTEAITQPSQQGGTQLVAKILVKGQSESSNVAINKPSKNALIQAFGDDTKDWIDKELTLHTETAIVSGKRGIALYLVPPGYGVKEDAGGYLVVEKLTPHDMLDDDQKNIDLNDIPF